MPAPSHSGVLWRAVPFLFALLTAVSAQAQPLPEAFQFGYEKRPRTVSGEPVWDLERLSPNERPLAIQLQKLGVQCEFTSETDPRTGRPVRVGSIVPYTITGVLVYSRETRFTRGDLRLLTKLPNLTTVEVSGIPLRGRDLKVLRGCPRLARLTLDCDTASGVGQKPNPQTDEDLQMIGTLRNLTSLDLRMIDGVTDEGVRGMLENLTKLTHLSISTREPNLRIFHAIPEMESLKWLKAGFRDEDPKRFRELPRLKNLEGLSMRGYRTVPLGAEAEWLTKLPKLRHLTVYGDLIDDQAFQHVAAIPSLQVLEIESNKLKLAQGWWYLQQARQLKALFVEGCALTDINCSDIAGIRSLEHLSLEDTPVTDRGVEHLTHHEGITTLGLQRMRITDASMQRIGENMRQIQRLNVSNTSITEDGIRAISRLPNLEFLDVKETALSDSCIPTVMAMPKLKSFVPPLRMSQQGRDQLFKKYNTW